jgi:hypothetical protein
METDRITLSHRERDRMRVLHEVKQGHLTHREAGRRLRLSDRRRQVAGFAWVDAQESCPCENPELKI